MTTRSLTIIPCAALLLMAPLSASFAQTAIDQAAPLPPANTLVASPAVAPISPGQHNRPAHPRCRHHAAGGKGDKHGKGCKAGHHRKGLQIQSQLERIEQRQILIETMLRQLLSRSSM